MVGSSCSDPAVDGFNITNKTVGPSAQRRRRAYRYRRHLEKVALDSITTNSTNRVVEPGAAYLLVHRPLYVFATRLLPFPFSVCRARRCTCRQIVDGFETHNRVQSPTRRRFQNWSRFPKCSSPESPSNYK